MPYRDTAPIGAPCWIDLYTSDTDQATTFYGELFGWTAESAGEEFGGYTIFTKSGRPVAGCMQHMNPGDPEQWSVYLASADARATAAAASGHGGHVVVEPMDVQENGTMAMLADPGGAGIGIWQPGTEKGFTVLGEPGAPSWFELHARDYDRAVSFYRDVFDWQPQVLADTEDFRYTTLGKDDAATAGIMDASRSLPDGEPDRWSVYFGVENADETLARVVELGGTVSRPAEDTPYGRLAEAADSTGARFKIVQG